jgi:hypothetical protein
MSEIKRITVEQVKAAYAETGLTPKRGTWRVGQFACGIGVIGEQVSRDNTWDGAVEYAASLGLDFDYVFGFIGGFDASGIPDEGESIEFRTGYSDGKAAAAAVFDPATAVTHKGMTMSRFFVIRQKSTGFLFPRTGRGSTWAEFTEKVSPRLFTTTAAAKNCLAWWLAGATMNNNSYGYDGDYDVCLETTKRPERIASDYEIVPAELNVILTKATA